MAQPTNPLLASYFTFAGDTVPVRDVGPSPLDFVTRVEAAARAGFTGFAMCFTDLPSVVARYGYAEMRAILAINGMRHLEYEACVDWFATGARGAAAAQPRQILMDAARELGGGNIKACGDMAGDWPLESMIEGFAALCDEACLYGARVSIEMVAFSNLATPQRVLDIVTAAGRSNGGMFLDIWHVMRGHVSLLEIGALQGSMIFGVELNDAAAAITGTLFEDTISNRRFCGDGDFDVAGFMRAVKATGYWGPYGVEILSTQVRHMPIDVLAQTAFRTTSQFVNPRGHA